MLAYIRKVFPETEIRSLEPLPQAGSDRKYYRLSFPNSSYIACESTHLEENETFFYLSEFFKSHGIPVPEIVHIAANRMTYTQEDVGSISLLDKIMQDGYTEEVMTLYKQSLSALVSMQILGKQDLDFSKCYSTQGFDKYAVLADLHYFKYYFLDLSKIPYDKAQLNVEFENLATQIGAIESSCFMYRDFQGRNIMIKNNQVHFIDYQGGMKGPLQYDVASLLWQAKAALPDDWKNELYRYYKQTLRQQIAFEEQTFDAHYAIILLIRLLQVLGAYGLRGIIEKKSHFLSSIPLGLKNIAAWRTQFILSEYPELDAILQKLTEAKSMDCSSFESILNTETEQHDAVNPTPSDKAVLHIQIQSFSYKKGIPEDPYGNGGGFVFDCRGLLNPGRFEPYKKLTGRDQAVQDFLVSKTRVAEFLQSAKNIVNISIEDYVQRGFEHLMIQFGCTGGQHRSVYCADKMAQYVKEKYHVEVSIHHIEQEAKGWVNE